MPSSVVTVDFKTSNVEDNNVSGAIPVASPTAVFPAVLATLIQLIFFHSFFSISTDFLPSVSLFLSSEIIELISAILESSNP